MEDPQKLKNYLLNERVVFEVHDKDTTILDALVTEKQYIHIEETDPIEELETDPKAKGAKGSKVQISKKEVPKPPPPFSSSTSKLGPTPRPRPMTPPPPH